MEREGDLELRDVQMDNFKGLLGIRRMDRVPNARIRELCGVKKMEFVRENALGVALGVNP